MLDLQVMTHSHIAGTPYRWVVRRLLPLAPPSPRGSSTRSSIPRLGSSFFPSCSSELWEPEWAAESVAMSVEEAARCEGARVVGMTNEYRCSRGLVGGKV